MLRNTGPILLCCILFLAGHFCLASQSIDEIILETNQILYQKPDSVISICMAHLEHYQNQGQPKLTNTIAAAYMVLGKYDSSRVYYSIGIQASNPKDKANAANGLGNVYIYEKDYQRALKYYLVGAAIYDSLQENLLLAGSYNNIGMVMSKIAESDQAAVYFKKALKIHEEANELDRTLPNLHNLADLFCKINAVDSALYYGQILRSRAKALSHDYGLAKAYEILAQVYMAQDSAVQALSASRKGQELMISMGDSSSLLEIRCLEIKALAAMGFNQESSAMARNILADSASLVTNLIPELLEILYKNAKKLGNESEALNLLERLTIVNEAIINQEKNQQILELEAKYETGKKESEIQFLSQQNEIQNLRLSRKSMILWGSVLFFVLVIVVGYFYYQHSLTLRRQESDNLRQRLLRIQLNPHFLYNAMSAIQSMIFEDRDPHIAANQLGHFSKLTRQILEFNQEEFITLDEEIAFVDNYIQVQQLRFDEPFEYKLEVDENMDIHTLMIPPMITQPFIENAIEHGVYEKGAEGYIHILFKIEHNQLIIQITDNGVGRATEHTLDLKKHRSMATEITKKRLALLSKKGKSALMKYIESDNDTGTTVRFELPLFT